MWNDKSEIVLEYLRIMYEENQLFPHHLFYKYHLVNFCPFCVQQVMLKNMLHSCLMHSHNLLKLRRKLNSFTYNRYQMWSNWIYSCLTLKLEQPLVSKFFLSFGVRFYIGLAGTIWCLGFIFPSLIRSFNLMVRLQLEINICRGDL